jgi:monoamine oxidase
MDDSENNYDTVNIGAGFAGLTAARDLADAGQRVLVLEGRERIGSRTWVDSHLGLKLEMGGTWVHWTQPYVWRELGHYGIGTVKSPESDRAVWFDDNGRRETNTGELAAELDGACAAFGDATRKYFPHGFDPFVDPDAAAIDDLRVDDRIAQLDLNPTQRELLRTFWALNFNGRTSEGAYSQALRWLASVNGNWKVLLETCSTYKIQGGTRALADAIFEDAVAKGAEFRFGDKVIEVDPGEDRVTVVSEDGVTTADRVVCTVPLHVLANIRFTGDVKDTVYPVVGRGQAGKGVKVWCKLLDQHETFFALGRPDWPINTMLGEYPVEDGAVAVCFGSDATALDVTDRGAVVDAVHRLFPDVEVGEIAAHNWVTDEYSGETWAMHSPGFFAESLPAFVEGTDLIRFAGSDFATGWSGFIDGAIESATHQSRRHHPRHHRGTLADVQGRRPEECWRIPSLLRTRNFQDTERPLHRKRLSCQNISPTEPETTTCTSLSRSAPSSGSDGPATATGSCAAAASGRWTPRRPPTPSISSHTVMRRYTSSKGRSS